MKSHFKPELFLTTTHVQFILLENGVVLKRSSNLPHVNPEDDNLVIEASGIILR